jgi:DNA helicase-2/ATP-dependent DNA helicase PcrA
MCERFRPNQAQLNAIRFPIDRPLKVVAGAGTGKTAVLTHRFIHLVEHHAIKPARILALTFSKKAAAEMHGRITRALLDKGLISRSEAPLLLWTGNFHSVCLRLLRQGSLLVGLDPAFEVIEETDQQTLFLEVVRDFLDGRLGADPGRFEELMVLRVSEFGEHMLRLINRLKSHFILPEDLKEKLGPKLTEHYEELEDALRGRVTDRSARANSRTAAEKRLKRLAESHRYESLRLDAVHDIYEAYQALLARRDLLDFNDLILYSYRLVLADPSIKRRFDYILLDEFQDTDYGQFKLLEALSRSFRNVTVVGDRKQSIYEWREARLENMDNFPGEMITLDENYRSYKEILDSANSFIGASMPSEQALRPACKGGRGASGRPEARLFRGETREAEAEFVAREICRLVNEDNRKPGDIAVLMRSVRSAGPYEEALSSHLVPFTTVGGFGFYEHNETKDILALLRLISNPFDDFSMARILQSPLVGLCDATLFQICRRRNEDRATLFDALQAPDQPTLPHRSTENIARIVRTLHELAEIKGARTVADLFSELLDRTGYLKYLSSIEGPRGPRFANVAFFYKLATMFEDRHPGAVLEDFLEYLENAMGAEVGSMPAETGANRVQIMTVHQAKGLEFPVVFVVNLGSKSFPLGFRSDAFGFDETYGFFATRMPNGDPTVRYDEKYGIGIKEHLKERQRLEENRIMYVAMTRARDRLYLTTSMPEDVKDGDFFQAVESFAQLYGTCAAPAAEPSPAIFTGAEVKPKPHLDVEDIKTLASEAIQRVSRLAHMPLAPPERTITLSYSRLALFRTCPMKYALRYLYDLPLSSHEESQDERHPEDADNALLMGNLLHDTLLRFHRRRRTGAPADAYEIFERLCEAQKVFNRMRTSGRKLLATYLKSSLAGIETLDEEKQFNWRLDDGPPCMMFEGKIDRLHREGDALKIVDYKAGAPDDEHHRLQLAIYRLAMQSISGERNILTSNFYFSSGEERVRDFSDEELSIIKNEIIEDARKIASEDFDALSSTTGASRNCGLCEYGYFCPSRTEELR